MTRTVHDSEDEESVFSPLSANDEYIEIVASEVEGAAAALLPLKSTNGTGSTGSIGTTGNIRQ